MLQNYYFLDPRKYPLRPTHGRRPSICAQVARMQGPMLTWCSCIYLDDPHVEAGLLGQLLPDVSGGLRCGRERRLQRLQLLGLDGGPRAPPLPTEVLVVVLVVRRFFVRQRSDLCLLQNHVVLELVLRVRR